MKTLPELFDDLDAVGCDPSSPCRPPDWRWRRARELTRDDATTKRKSDDKWVKRIARFQKALVTCSGGSARRQWTSGFEDMTLAHMIRYSWSDRARWELEARLLAGQDDRDIAARFEIPATAVAAY